MSDPITTIATVLSEHPQTVATVASVYGVAKPFLAKILGPAADEVGEIGREYIKGFRAKNVNSCLDEADKKLADAGIDPQSIPPKVLVPLLESASLEDNDFLSDHWSSLLANAANPESKAKVDGNLIDILKQLTPKQALIFTVFGRILSKNSDMNVDDKVELTIPTDELKKTVDKLNSLNANAGFDISKEEFNIALDNLVRLRLCTTSGTEAMTSDLKSLPPKEAFIMLGLLLTPGRANIGITYLGLAFLNACEAPVKKVLN